MFKDIGEFKAYLEKLFVSTYPNVVRDEARAGVLGYHPLALLAIAMDYIEALESDVEANDNVLLIEHAHNKDMQAALKHIHEFVDKEMEDIHGVLCNECVHKLLNINGYSDQDIERFIARIKNTVDTAIAKAKEKEDVEDTPSGTDTADS